MRNRTKITNRILSALQRLRFYGLLSIIIFVMYKVRGKKVSKVSFRKELNVWEFEVDNVFYYSIGPGWSYDQNFLLNQFKSNLGHFYLPKEGDVVFDVGAGIGDETILFSQLVGPKGKVFAIEAHPITFKTLALNKQKNKLDNVILINKAISDSSGYIFIQNENSLANKITTSKHNDAFKVESITLDQLIELHKIDQVDFVKVNIEGAEQLLIKGLNKTISKILRLAISCHDFRYHAEGDEFFKTKEIILAFFKQHNYVVRVRDTQISILDDYVYAYSPKISLEV